MTRMIDGWMTWMMMDDDTHTHIHMMMNDDDMIDG